MKQIVLMAAGLGSRMGDITKVTHKALIPVRGKPIIEWNIEFAIEAKMDRIILVVGYKKENFEYLIEKYKDKIEIITVFNERYSEFNTLSTIYCAGPYLTMDTWIVCADLFLINNIYQKYISDHNFYLHRIVKDLNKPEWVAELSPENCITSVNTSGYSGSIYSGVSFWPQKDIQYIDKLINEADWKAEKTKKMYWDEILFPAFSTWNVYVKHYDGHDIMEIDDQEDLEALQEYVRSTEKGEK